MFNSSTFVGQNLCSSVIGVDKYYGPVLLSVLTVSFSSGLTIVFTFLYLRLFPNDPRLLKVLVVAVWFFDIAQTAMNWHVSWFWLIHGFGDISQLNLIPLPLMVTIGLNMGSTMIVHSFYIRRIFCLSKRGLWLGLPIIFLMISRIGIGAYSLKEMVRYKTFSTFLANEWLVSLGLAFCVVVDVAITLTIAVLLWDSRRQASRLSSALDSLILYTLESGFVTGCASVAVLIVWLVINDKMIFTALYLATGKLYGHSMIITLINRHCLRRETDITVNHNQTEESLGSQFLRINVSQSVQYETHTIN